MTEWQKVSIFVRRLVLRKEYQKKNKETEDISGIGKKGEKKNDLLSDATNGYQKQAMVSGYLKQLISSEINKFAEFNRVQKEPANNNNNNMATTTQSESLETGNWSVRQTIRSQSRTLNRNRRYTERNARPKI